MNSNQKFLLAMIILVAALSGNVTISAFLTDILVSPYFQTSPSKVSLISSPSSSFLDSVRICKPYSFGGVYA